MDELLGHIKTLNVHQIWAKEASDLTRVRATFHEVKECPRSRCYLTEQRRSSEAVQR